METPYYVLRTNEGVLGPKGGTNEFARKAVLVIIGMLIISSFIFKENMFKGLNWTARVLLISLFIKFVLPDKNRIPSPIEIRFYNQYLVVYRENYHYDKNNSRMEFNRFYYKDIAKCSYNTKTQEVFIYGTMEAVWYNYNMDGRVPSQPTYYGVIPNSCCFFHIGLSPEANVIGTIERYSPIKVLYE